MSYASPREQRLPSLLNLNLPEPESLMTSTISANLYRVNSGRSSTGCGSASSMISSEAATISSVDREGQNTHGQTTNGMRTMDEEGGWREERRSERRKEPIVRNLVFYKEIRRENLKE
uniref:Uncharacterized protein n=1 Tax=Pristionchus pacificus TaxID=54126 RepID=A0A2A6C117_PRIPA|eukprot:PDM71721.1 hypothetical protein PRIPAC_38128 [Pristionchus pacificus]